MLKVNLVLFHSEISNHYFFVNNYEKGLHITQPFQFYPVNPYIAHNNV